MPKFWMFDKYRAGSCFRNSKGTADETRYMINCTSGKIDIETDGDSWHANPERAEIDNRRDNALKMSGWTVLRFNTHQVCEEATEYCLPTIAKTINSLGGVDENGAVPRRIELPNERGMQQKSLFDDLESQVLENRKHQLGLAAIRPTESLIIRVATAPQVMKLQLQFKNQKSAITWAW